MLIDKRITSFLSSVKTGRCENKRRRNALGARPIGLIVPSEARNCKSRGGELGKGKRQATRIKKLRSKKKIFFAKSCVARIKKNAATICKKPRSLSLMNFRFAERRALFRRGASRFGDRRRDLRWRGFRLDGAPNRSGRRRRLRGWRRFSDRRFLRVGDDRRDDATARFRRR